MRFSILHSIKNQLRKLKSSDNSLKYEVKLLNLPDEILNEIFSSLPLECLYYLIFINKQAHEIIKGIIKSYLNVEINIDGNHIIKNIDVYWDKSKDAYYTANNGVYSFEGNIKLIYNKYNFIIYFYKPFEINKFFEIIPPSIYNIKIFKVCYKQIKFKVISSFIRKMRKLEQLELISNWNELTFNDIFDMLNPEALKVLKIKCPGTLNLIGLDKIVEFKKLYKLRLDCSYLDYRQFKPINIFQSNSIQYIKTRELIYNYSFGQFFYLPNLKSLKLLFNQNEDYHLNSTLAHNSNIHTFGLIRSNLLFNIKLNNHENLKELYINGDIIQQFIESKFDLNNIEIMNFSEIRHSTRLYKVNKKWNSKPDIIKSKLKYINFKDCTLSIQEMFYIINHFNSIEKVKVKYGTCFSLGSTSVKYFGDSNLFLLLLHKDSICFSSSPLPRLENINYFILGNILTKE